MLPNAWTSRGLGSSCLLQYPRSSSVTNLAQHSGPGALPRGAGRKLRTGPSTNHRGLALLPVGTTHTACPALWHLGAQSLTWHGPWPLTPDQPGGQSCRSEPCGSGRLHQEANNTQRKPSPSSDTPQPTVPFLGPVGETGGGGRLTPFLPSGLQEGTRPL